MGKKVDELPEDVRAVIALTAAKAAEETASKINTDGIGGKVNYYRIMEQLLRNYKRLKALVDDEESYMRVELQGHSNSLVRFNPNATGKSLEVIEEEIEQEKTKSYVRTKANFHEVERVVRLFSERKEFIVIRMYYFGEDAHGQQRAQEQCTWEEIADELSALGVLKDAKTARRWRSKLIGDMSVCMFGRAAAVAGGLFAAKMQ